jgi:hypothetical protein
LFAVPEPRFLFVCAPSSLSGTPSGWAREMLEEGEVALLGSEGIDAVNGVAHDLDQTAIELIRIESTPERQVETVMQHAGAMPLIWVDGSFSEHAQRWAHDRGPMTLLTQSSGPLDEEERRRIDRFVAILGRQSE